MKTIFISVLSLLIISGFSAQSQNILDNKIYRVTAYKQNDTTVWSMSNHRELIPPISIFIPNAFTPNGDGINDTFGVKGEGIKEFTLNIFNRWGELIFETHNPKQQWDGTYMNNPVEIGEYVYTMKAAGFGSRVRSGAVALVR